jgi:hypothetical protein
MRTRHGRLLLASFVVLTTACQSKAGAVASATPHEAVYVALAERLLQWAGSSRGVFEARPSLAGLDPREVEEDLAYVAREIPDLDPALLAEIRETSRDTSCLRLPTNWRAHGLRLETLCGPPSLRYPVAERARRSRPSALGTSAIAFSSDSSRALVVGMIICDGLCGHAAFYLFDRTGTGWQVAHVVVIGES